MRFLDIKTDFAFKKVFGAADSKPRLISFLNALVYDDSDVKIADLTIVDPYNIPLLKGMKDSFVDVKAILSDGTKVIIEMQVLSCEGFEKRVLYNAAKNYSTQLLKGERYDLLNPIIALTIVDFVMFDETDQYITKFKLLEKDKFIRYNDDLELVFIELPKFEKELDTLSGVKEEWVWFVKNAGSLEYVPETFSQDVKGAFDVANQANMTQEELDIQFKKRDYIALQKGSLALAQKQGLKQGIEQGLKQGLEQGMEHGSRKKSVEIALNLLDVLDCETVARKTGLSVEEVKALRN